MRQVFGGRPSTVSPSEIAQSDVRCDLARIGPITTAGRELDLVSHPNPYIVLGCGGSTLFGIGSPWPRGLKSAIFFWKLLSVPDHLCSLYAAWRRPLVRKSQIL